MDLTLGVHCRLLAMEWRDRRSLAVRADPVPSASVALFSVV
jgi:hypothetical protein